MAHDAETKKTLWQMAKFAIVGVLNTLVDFAVFQSLNLTLGWVYAAQVIGYTAGIINSYLWNSNWTFREQRTRSLREMGLFLLVNLASLGVSLGMIWLLRDVVGITNEWVAGWMPVDEFADRLGFSLRNDRDFETVAGFVIDMMGALPDVGDVITHAGWRIEVATVVDWSRSSAAFRRW